MRGTFEEPPTGLIPWFSKTEGNTYATIATSPFPLQGKPTQAQYIARRISGAIAGEVFAQVKTYQVPITNSSPSHLHYLPFASCFPLRHFTLAVLFALLTFDLMFACAFYLLASLLARNLLIRIHLKCSTWIIFDPYALVLKPQIA